VAKGESPKCGKCNASLSRLRVKAFAEQGIKHMFCQRCFPVMDGRKLEGTGAGHHRPTAKNTSQRRDREGDGSHGDY